MCYAATHCVHVVYVRREVILSYHIVCFSPYLVVVIVRCDCSDFGRACNVAHTVVDWETQGGTPTANKSYDVNSTLRLRLTCTTLNARCGLAVPSTINKEQETLKMFVKK